MRAEPFLTVFTVKAGVCLGGKAFGMLFVRNLPTQKQEQRTRQKAVRIRAWNKYQRCEHHCKVPIVNATCGTAAVFHKPGLKRTEIKDADDVANRKYKRNDNKN